MFQPIYHLRFHGGPFDGVAETPAEFVPTNKLQMPATPRLAERNAACQGSLVEPWCAAYRLVRKDHDLAEGRPVITLRYEFLAYEMVEMPHERGLPVSLAGQFSAWLGGKIAPIARGLMRWLTAPVEYPLQSSRWTCAPPLPQAASATPASCDQGQQAVPAEIGRIPADASATPAPGSLHNALRSDRRGRLPGKAR
jgi:hypothetical protein